ncbi:1-aminocyclopropane-1-carboxylate deaminase/D-cysteine desulfhydrase [Hahella ganghwensis]|uniref:1-aminocyclopropane-1-carboxylate deaminase/D-cysteine desulfhydrase n=1 Tax=Hahella ganghwensis TaxID=286420 RepID=UPI0003672878|nr:pyridoxal-phosphate dependent enzyme [Hahella ganghwensis]
MIDPPLIIQSVDLSAMRKYGLELYIVRGDLTHPDISGNKWYKLKYNLKYAMEKGYKAILSFGGAYSNHLHALAAAGHQYQLKTIGVVRGHWRTEYTATLQDAVNWGMQLVPVTHEDYRRRYDQSWVEEQLANWLQVSGLAQEGVTGKEVLVVPEGGSNRDGVRGVRDWAGEIYSRFDRPVTIVLPVGSGGTIAGFAAENSRHQVVGISVVKAAESQRQTVEALLAEGQGDGSSWEIVSGFEGAGYGKWDQQLVTSLNEVNRQVGIPLEPVYSGKAFHAMMTLAGSGHFNTAQVVFVHTGGLQGGRSEPALEWLA